jgi:hypothetical protein
VVDRAAVEGLLRVVGTDGHGIYAVDALVAAGLPPALVMGLARWHRPLGVKAGGLRGADGREAGAVWGVHGLELLLAVARGLGLELVDLPGSWRQAGYAVAVALAAWVAQHGGGAIPLEPMPLATVAPGPLPPPDLPGPSRPSKLPGSPEVAEEVHSGRTPTALMALSPEAAELIRGRTR